MTVAEHVDHPHRCSLSAVLLVHTKGTGEKSKAVHMYMYLYKRPVLSGPVLACGAAVAQTLRKENSKIRCFLFQSCSVSYCLYFRL